MTVNVHATIESILAKSGGQIKVAEQAVRNLAAGDHAFLLGLVEPYLNGIIAHALERARKDKPILSAGRPSMARHFDQLPKKVRPASPKTKAVSKDVLGEVMNVLAQNFTVDEAKVQPAVKASDKHVNTLKALAKKNYQSGKKD